MRAIVYVRVSSEAQDANYSIPGQIDEAQEYAKQHGLRIVAIYRENASGFRYPRPELEKALVALEHGEASALIVHCEDRLNRHGIFGALIRKRILDAGTELHYTLSGKHEIEEEDIVALIKDWAASKEIRGFVERGTRGKRQKAKSGAWPGVGSPPYGYRVVGHKRDTILEINEDEAKWVRKIYEWYAVEGISVSQIAERLHQFGVPRPGSTRQKSSDSHVLAWANASIYNILRRETYIGRFYYNRRLDKRGPTGKRMVSEHPCEEWIEVPVPAIIDEALFNKAQARMAEGRQKSFRNRKYEYLMGTRLTCGNCGHSMSSMPVERGKYMYYRCHSYKRDEPGRKKCGQVLFNVQAVDGAIWDFLRGILQDPETLRLSVEQAQEEARKDNQHIRDSIGILDEEIRKQRGKLSRAVDLYLESEDSPLTRQLAKDKQRECEDTLHRLHQERAELGRYIAQSEISTEALASVEEYIAGIRDELDLLGFEDRKEIVGALGATARLVLENGQRVAYLTLLLQTHRVEVERAGEAEGTGGDGFETDSMDSSKQKHNLKALSPTIPLTFRLTLPAA
jgi:site-specific DNA recombinase